MRSLVVALALISAAPAGAGELWPQPDGGWRFALTVPEVAGRQRFGYVDAEPAPPGGWMVIVTCRVESTRDGRVLSRVVGKGEATRGRSPGFGGNWQNPDGPRGAFIVTQDPKRAEDLRLYGEFVGPECPRQGRGDLSSGD